MKDAAEGQVTWQNPLEISQFLKLQQELKQMEEAEAAALEAKNKGDAVPDMDGVMTEAQLEAEKLLRDIERERRSGGRRGKKAGGDS